MNRVRLRARSQREGSVRINSWKGWNMLALTASLSRRFSAHQSCHRRRARVTATAAFAAVAASALASQYARAVVVNDTWLTATNGTWSDPTKWSAAVVPNNGANTYAVTIGATGSPYTLTLNTTNTVDSLTLNSADATLSHTTGTFTATGGLNLLAGTYSLAGGTIANTTINATV